jgi:hypothetical protein
VNEVTYSVSKEARYKVFQGFAAKLYERYGVEKEDIRDALKEYDMDMEESCAECNESVAHWDFDAKGDRVLCADCEVHHRWLRPCEGCKKSVDAFDTNQGKPFAEGVVHYCTQCKKE